jgi:uncharacterized protein YfaS (alpha-2-macroglobulin family)
VQSGERVESVITIEAKNNYEYLLFEDLKPGGLEAVEIRSGENLFAKEIKSGALTQKKSTLMNYTYASEFTGRTRWVYQELRDRKGCAVHRSSTGRGLAVAIRNARGESRRVPRAAGAGPLRCTSRRSGRMAPR